MGKETSRFKLDQIGQAQALLTILEIILTVPNVQCYVPSESFEPFPSQGRHGAQSRMP